MFAELQCDSLKSGIKQVIKYSVMRFIHGRVSGDVQYRTEDIIYGCMIGTMTQNDTDGRTEYDEEEEIKRRLNEEVNQDEHI